MHKDTTFSAFTICCGKKTHSFTRPVVMGILNATADSFYDGGRYTNEAAIMERADRIVQEGADIIDIGVVSSRPGAELLPPQEEAQRLAPIVAMVRSRYPDMLISVDTCFSLPARMAVEAGADIINDISGGQFDEMMFQTVAQLQVPYILMHTVGTPDHMQDNPHYDNILEDVAFYFSERVNKLHRLGVKDIILDPGFGFAKTLDDNYRLFNRLPMLQKLFPDLPLLVALSRKSMIYRLTGETPADALPGTLALDILAIEQGAQLIRVHDVKEAVQTIKVWEHLKAVRSL